MMNVPVEKWRWFGCPGHLIVGHSCRFHLHTRIGNYRVSTVGEYWPERPSREIHAKVVDPTWLTNNIHLKGDDFDNAYFRRFGYQEIGVGRKYETFVFEVTGEANDGEGEVADWGEIDSLSANDEHTATRNHMVMCRRMARKKAKT